MSSFLKMTVGATYIKGIAKQDAYPIATFFLAGLATDQRCLRPP